MVKCSPATGLFGAISFAIVIPERSSCILKSPCVFIISKHCTETKKESPRDKKASSIEQKKKKNGKTKTSSHLLRKTSKDPRRSLEPLPAPIHSCTGLFEKDSFELVKESGN